MKTIFDNVIKILLIVLFAALIYEFHIFIGEYRNHERYFSAGGGFVFKRDGNILFDKRTGDLYYDGAPGNRWELRSILPNR